MRTANASRVAVVGGEIHVGQLPTPVQAVAPVSTRDDPVRQTLDSMGRLEAKLEEVMISRKAPPPKRQVLSPDTRRGVNLVVGTVEEMAICTGTAQNQRGTSKELRGHLML